MTATRRTLDGFRGLTTILGTWAMLFMDTFFSQLSGVSKTDLKVAFMATLPITLKVIWVDVRPKVMEWFK